MISSVISTVRLIPAHAGKTVPALQAAWAQMAHPRSRGENDLMILSRRRNQGSSPLTQGKLVVHVLEARGTRLIPAHAGKTPSRSPWRRGWGAHPRSRRENSIRAHLTTVGRGSSPLTRGKRVGEPRGDLFGGLIPAHAGKTHSGSPAPGRRRAHPRSRGENHRLTAGIEDAGGSSPLTRGKRSHVRVGHLAVRLIPAHAGKTS